MEVVFYAKDGDNYYIGQLHEIQLSNNTTMNVTLQQAAGIPTWNAFLQTNLPKVSLVFLRVDRVCQGTFFEAKVAYPDGNTTIWMIERDKTTAQCGVILPYVLPLPVGSSITGSIVSLKSPPFTTSISSAEIASGSVEVSMPLFDVRDPDTNSLITDATVLFLKHVSYCNIPEPNMTACKIAEMRAKDFAPLRVIMAGKLNIRIVLGSGHIVEFIGVDLINSGPLKADIDVDPETYVNRSTSTIEKIWKIGSFAPDMYEYVLIGIPYDTTVEESQPVNMSIPVLYDDNWNIIWNGTGPVPSYYSDFDPNFFISGVLCSDTDANLTETSCYRDKASNMVWIKIPHFSGIGPELSGTLDSTAPTISDLSPSDGHSTTNTRPTFSFKVTDNDPQNTCHLYIDGSLAATATVDTNTTSSITPSSSLPAGSHTWCILCEDGVLNQGQSQDRTIGITSEITSPPSGGDSGAGGGGFIVVSPTPYPPIDLDGSLDLMVGYKVEFTYSGSTHSLEIEKIYENKVKIVIKSEPTIIEIAEGETKEVDIDGDSINDIAVTVEQIYNATTARVTISLVLEEVEITPEEVDVAPEKEKVEEKVEEKIPVKAEPEDTYLPVSVAVVVAIVGAGIVLFVLRKKFH